MVAASGLQPISSGGGGQLVLVNPGNGLCTNPIASTFQVKVTTHGSEWFVQASVAMSVKLWVRWQALVVIVPAVQSSVGVPQLSDTVTSARAVAQVGCVGLQCRSTVPVGQPLIT